MNWRRFILALHRDLGYFFTGVTVLYAISGLAVNHADDWNPSFVSCRTEVKLDLPSEQSKIDTKAVKANLAQYGEADNYRGYDFPSPQKIKIYLKDGDVVADLKSGMGSLETYRRRVQMNLIGQNGHQRATSSHVPRFRSVGINDGKGVLFVGHTGAIQPSGFLPINCGVFPRHSVVDVYQRSPLFQALRDSTKLEGKCRLCEFRNICGGSRARAYAVQA